MIDFLLGNVYGVDSRIVNGALTLYVSPDGSDTTGDGSLDKPFKTIGKAAAEFYNGLVGVSNCTIRLMDGTYTLTANVIFYNRSRLSLTSASGDRTKVTITGNEYALMFYGGYTTVSHITRTYSTYTSRVNQGTLIFNGAGLVSNVTVNGYLPEGGGGANGVQVSVGNVSVNNSVLNNCATALLSHAGGVLGMNNVSGSGSWNVKNAIGGFISVGTGNTITGTVDIMESGGGRVFT